MSHTLTEFEPLAGPLGLELVDELSAYRHKFDVLKGQPEVQAIAFLLPLMEGMLKSASDDRTSVHGWCLSGLFNNVRVNVRPVMTSASGGGAGHTETQVEALFVPPLQLGLKITYEALVLRLVQKVTGKHDLQTGNSELDRVIHVNARDTDAARLLLAGSDIQQILLAAYTKYPFPLITDTIAQVIHYGLETDVDVLKGDLASMAGIVRALGSKAAGSSAH